MSRFSVRPMTEAEARAINAWRYDPPYTFYNPEASELEDILAQMLDGTYHVVVDDQGVMAGFVAFGGTAQIPGGHTHGAYRDEALDVGLGMRPDLTGRGLGLEFLRACIAFARERYSPPMLRLSVAIFNRRAITVYERAGFQPGPVVPSPAPGGEVDFLVMMLPLPVTSPASPDDSAG